jgi:hypothetical protein
LAGVAELEPAGAVGAAEPDPAGAVNPLPPVESGEAAGGVDPPHPATPIRIPPTAAAIIVLLTLMLVPFG